MTLQVLYATLIDFEDHVKPILYDIANLICIGSIITLKEVFAGVLNLIHKKVWHCCQIV